LFGHATEDDFILPHHSDKIYESYIVSFHLSGQCRSHKTFCLLNWLWLFQILQGDKNIIKFDGDHNSPRPQFYFDSITIFFHNVLNPPEVPEDHYFMTPHGSLGQVKYWYTQCSSVYWNMLALLTLSSPDRVIGIQSMT
jgi:hypothetical protein